MKSKTVATADDLVEGCSGDGDSSEKSGVRVAPLIITGLIIVAGMILTSLYKEEINAFGMHLMGTYGRTWVDGALFLVCAISCTPLTLPVWGYALIGVAMGYNVIRLAAVMALGSALGSFVTFSIGRFFANQAWVKKRFASLLEHPWARGRSKKYVGWILLVGTASPIPCDVFYAACGAKKFPIPLFIALTLAGRFIRYLYLGYGFKYFSSYF